MRILVLISIYMLFMCGAPAEAKNIRGGAGYYCHLPELDGTVTCWGPQAPHPRRHVPRHVPERPEELSLYADVFPDAGTHIRATDNAAVEVTCG